MNILKYLICLFVFSIYAKTIHIEANMPLTTELLDYAWGYRENITNQRVIANYLLTRPAVPNDYETAWKVARMVYFIGNYGIGEKEYVSTKTGAELFKYGSEAAKIAIDLAPDKVEGYFWYGIDLGSYGLAYGIFAAASHAKEGIDALKQANDIDPTYQWYGPSRILARYYQELPWIFGGSNKKALELLSIATKNKPEFSNNWVFLGQFYTKTGDKTNALLACKNAATLKPQDGMYEEVRYLREANECILANK